MVSDAASGPYVGVHRLSALELLARWVHHVPEPYASAPALDAHDIDARAGPWADAAA